jgi:hypothetical protein
MFYTVKNNVDVIDNKVNLKIDTSDESFVTPPDQLQQLEFNRSGEKEVVDWFDKRPEYWCDYLAIVSQETDPKLSLTFIKWVVTDFARETGLILVNNNRKKTIYPLTTTLDHVEDGDQFIKVYDRYNQYLMIYSSKMFDIYARDSNMIYGFIGARRLTNAKQMMFFKWLYEDHIIDFIFNEYKFLYSLYTNHTFR